MLLITISLCMIVKNEQETLGRCLSSVAAAADEIIIVDTGSTDRTKAIARAFTDKIYAFEWIDDFAAARNFAFQQATMEYIMWLDADDVLKEEDLKKLIALKTVLDRSVDSVTMVYHIAFDEYGNPTTKLRRNRLVKSENKFRWIGAIHEYLEVWGNILNSEVVVTHGRVHGNSDRNLKIYQRRLARGEPFSPRDLYYYANELRDHSQIQEAIVFYEKFLQMKQGWIEDVISACGKLADCYHISGNPLKELESTLKSFQYDRPRAEFCCRLGYYFLNENKFDAAVFWYKMATELEMPKQNWGFSNPAYSTWLPHLQLCVCYDRTGQYELADKHNEEALRYRPNDPRMLQNQEYLQAILNRSRMN
jgi:glycosyltransferase involved in cell wall biosynthesis